MDPRLLATMKVAAREEEEDSEMIERRSKCDKIQEGVNRLPTSLREVVIDGAFLDRSQRQIANDLGISQAAVCSRRRKALLILKKILGRS